MFAKVLVLNISYQPIAIINWQRAIVLVWQNRADVVVTTDNICRSPSVALQVPSIIRLKRYVRPSPKFFLKNPSRENILARDNWTCQYCGTKLNRNTATIDHIVPRSKGGPNTWSNMVACCVSCNNKKGNRTPEESGMRLIREPKGWSLDAALDERWKPFLYSS